MSLMEAIEDIKSQLNRSMEISNSMSDEYLNDNILSSSSDIGDIVENLNSQVEYNNSLLQQIQDLEAQNIAFVHHSKIQDQTISDLRFSLDQCTEVAVSLEERLTSCLDINEKMSSRCKRVENENIEDKSLISRLEGEIEAQALKIRGMEMENNELSGRVREFEKTIQWFKQSQHDSTTEGSSKLSRIQSSLERSEKTLQDCQIRNQQLEDENSQYNEENRKLKKQVDRILQRIEEDTQSINHLSTENRKLIQSHDSWKLKYHELSVVFNDLEESERKLRASYDTLIKSNEQKAINSQELEQQNADLEVR